MNEFRLESAPNFRDLGGLVARDSRIVRDGQIFRSEAVLAPTEGDAAVLSEIGVEVVIDLRRAIERSQAPNSWWRGQGAKLLELDVLDDIGTSSSSSIGPWGLLAQDATPRGAHALMRGTYSRLPRVGGGALRTILTLLSGRSAPIIIHCTAGKDRTGFVSAMILCALGVRKEDIVRDYLASAGHYDEAVVSATRALGRAKTGLELSDEVLEVLCTVDRSYLAVSFDVIDAEYGGVDRYLRTAAGLTDELQQALCTRLLQ